MLSRDKLPDMPASLIALTCEPRGKKTGAEPIPEMIPIGQRDATVISVLGSLQRRGAPKKVLEATATALVDCMEQSPSHRFTVTDALRKVESISKYEPEDSAFCTPLYSKVQNAERKTLEFIRLCEVPDPGPPQYVLEPLFLKDTLNWIYAEGGSLKSYLAMYFGIAMAHGLDVLDMPTMCGDVLYIDGELSAELQSHRYHQILAGLGLTANQRFHYIELGTDLVSSLPAIRAYIEVNNIMAVFVDSYGMAVRGNPNDPEVVNAVCNHLKSLHVTVVVIDHQGKMQQGQRLADKTSYGSVYKFNNARSVWQFVKSDDGPDYVTLMLNHRKSNFSRLHDPIGLRCSFTNGFTVEKTDVDTSFTEGLTSKQAVLAALKELGEATADELSEDTGLAAGTVRNQLAKLKAAETVAIVRKDGKKPVYTLPALLHSLVQMQNAETNPQANDGELLSVEEVVAEFNAEIVPDGVPF